MNNTKKYLITRERHEVVRIRLSGQNRAFCLRCQTETFFLTLDETVSFSQIRAGEILDYLNAGEIHAEETASGHLRLCRNSLARAIRGDLR